MDSDEGSKKKTVVIQSTSFYCRYCPRSITTRKRVNVFEIEIVTPPEGWEYEMCPACVRKVQVRMEDEGEGTRGLWAWD